LAQLTFLRKLTFLELVQHQNREILEFLSCFNSFFSKSGDLGVGSTLLVTKGGDFNLMVRHFDNSILGKYVRFHMNQKGFLCHFQFL